MLSFMMPEKLQSSQLKHSAGGILRVRVHLTNQQIYLAWMQSPIALVGSSVLAGWFSLAWSFYSFVLVSLITFLPFPLR